MLRAFLVLCGLMTALSTPAIAQSIGKVVAVTQLAYIESGGRNIRFVTGSEVSSGDVIVTDAGGLVQLTFEDFTRIVVGPNSRLNLSDIAMNTSGKAERFLVNAIGGTFRFLSGDTDKENYEIRTPTATFGIRGTVFDFHAQAARTDTFVHVGKVLKCGLGNICQSLVHRCIGSTNYEDGSFTNPQTPAERDAMILAFFPYIESQEPLLGTFRTNTRFCGPKAQQIRREPRERPTPVAPPPPPPIL